MKIGEIANIELELGLNMAKRWVIADASYAS